MPWFPNYGPLGPGVPGTPIEQFQYKRVGYTAVDINGNTSSHSFIVTAGTDDGDILDALEEIFDQSYASPLEVRISRVIAPENIAELNSADDVAGNLSRVLTLSFADKYDGMEVTKPIEVPAPHPGLLDSSGTFNRTASRSGDLLTDILACINNGTPDFNYKAATVGQRKYNLKGKTRTRTVAVPGGYEPGTIPGIDEDGSPS